MKSSRFPYCSLLAVFLVFPVFALSDPVSDDADEDDLEDLARELEEMDEEFATLMRELEAMEGGEAPPYHFWFAFQGGLGYRDNVLRSAVNREGSSYLFQGFDLLLDTLPATGPRLRFFLFGENLIFFRGFDDERLLALQIEASHRPAPEWELALPVHVTYHDAVVDVSTREEDLGTVRARSTRLTAEPGVVFIPRSESRAGVRLIGRQAFVRDPLDDFREFGGGITWEEEIVAGTSLDASGSAVRRRYGSREALTADGEPIEGRRREFSIFDLRGNVRHAWDTDGRWESRFDTRLELNRDNGGGYFDFLRPSFGHRLTYTHTPWRVIAGGRVSRYRYDTRSAGEASERDLRRTVWNANARAEYSLNAAVLLFAEFDHDRVSTNEVDASYRVNTTLLGGEWSF